MREYGHTQLCGPSGNRPESEDRQGRDEVEVVSGRRADMETLSVILVTADMTVSSGSR